MKSSGEELHHMQSVTNDHFAEFVKNHMLGHNIDSLLLDISDYQGTYKVDSYVKADNGEHHIFSFWRRNMIEDMGVTTLKPFELEMLKSL
jgi:hypothetical protein